MAAGEVEAPHGAALRAALLDAAPETVRSRVADLVNISSVAGLRVAPRGELWVVTTTGTELRLPVMRARDLPQLAALSGGRIDVPPPAAQ